jgi:hypothetical protein
LFDSGIEETGSVGIICLVCHQVLSSSSAHATSLTGKQLLANADRAILNELTKLEVTDLTSLMVSVTALAFLKMQGHVGNTIL